MKYLRAFPLLILTGCGLYVGVDQVAYLPEGLPEGTNAVNIVPPEAVKTLAAVAVGGLKAYLGPFAPLASLAPGLFSIMISIFVTKRKKRK